MRDGSALLDELPMAKKKAKRAAGRPPITTGAKDERLSIRARSEWMHWLQEFADFRREEKAQVVDKALAHLAKMDGFRVPPRR